jgi:hypothetical protein
MMKENMFIWTSSNVFPLGDIENPNVGYAHFTTQRKFSYSNLVNFLPPPAFIFFPPGIVEVQAEVGIQAEAEVVVHDEDLRVVLVGLGRGHELLPVRPGGRRVLRQRPDTMEDKQTAS